MKAAVSAQPRVRHSPPGGAVVQLASEAKTGTDTSPKFVRIQYGANQSETHHVLPASRSDVPAKQKLEYMYKDGAGERTARSFAGERPRQILRWIATVLFARFPGAVEIQCYWDTETKALWISSNKNSENEKIAKALVAGVEQFKSDSCVRGRDRRHAKKLIARAKYADQEMIYAVLAEGKARVPPEQCGVDFHAERRIQHTLGKQLDPAFLAGVKRPCLVCAMALNIVKQSRPGPLWNSAPALAGGYTLDGVLDHAVANGIITHVTRDRFTGKLDTGHDTDSGSDEE